MRIFLDTAIVEEIREINSLGFLAGVTTNPTLIAKAGGDFHQTIKEICEIVDGPVNAEPFSIELTGILKEAEVLAKLHPNVVVKVPMSEDGLKAISQLKKQGIRTNATLIFSANQALLAARAGADYVSPFVGRLDDTGNDGLYVLEEILTVFDQYAIETEVIAASIRHPMHVTGAAKIGAHIATIPYPVIKTLIRHPLTDQGIARFVADSKQYMQK
ncbi:MAG: fructose-6-phosphate aldolase [Chitinophagales bacterium]